MTLTPSRISFSFAPGAAGTNTVTSNSSVMCDAKSNTNLGSVSPFHLGKVEAVTKSFFFCRSDIFQSLSSKTTFMLPHTISAHSESPQQHRYRRFIKATLSTYVFKHTILFDKPLFHPMPICESPEQAEIISNPFFFRTKQLFSLLPPPQAALTLHC